MRVEGRSGPFLVTILDVSKSGLRLSSPVLFPVGSKVTVTCRGAAITGEVRFTFALAGEIHIGIVAGSASAAAIDENGEMDLTRLFHGHFTPET